MDFEMIGALAIIGGVFFIFFKFGKSGSKDQDPLADNLHSDNDFGGDD
ncbi:MAG: hypothetical protein MI702_03445 [Chlorobiales bacterium]|nr:hypothetical protein [Chlorobiales bacterium]